MDICIQNLLCKNCHLPTLREDTLEGNITCINCGLVIDTSIISCAPEWRCDEGKADKSRVGMASTDPNKIQLTCGQVKGTIGKKYRSVEAIFHANQYDNEFIIKKYVSSICDKLHLQKIWKDKACFLFEKLKSILPHFRNHSLQAISAALVMLIGKESNGRIHISAQDLQFVSNCSLKKIKTEYKFLKNNTLPGLRFSPEAENLDPNKISTAPSGFDNCVNNEGALAIKKTTVEETLRICSLVNSNLRVQSKWIAEIICEERFLDGKQPKTVACLSAYLPYEFLQDGQAREMLKKLCAKETGNVGAQTLKKYLKDFKENGYLQKIENQLKVKMSKN